MPFDYSLDSGCFIFDNDLTFYEIEGNIQNELAKTKYLFYQFVYNERLMVEAGDAALPGRPNRFSINQELINWNESRGNLSEKFKITKR